MDEILKQFPYITEVQKKQFEMLLELYEDWNSKINVISRKDIDELTEAAKAEGALGLAYFKVGAIHESPLQSPLLKSNQHSLFFGRIVRQFHPYHTTSNFFGI